MPFLGSIWLWLAKTFLGQKVKEGVGFLSQVPTPVWEAVAVLGYMAALVALHQHQAHAAIAAADKAGYDRAMQDDAKVIADLRQRAAAATANGKTIAADTRSKNDAENASIHAAAGSMLAHGPGAARCGRIGNPAVPAASDQPGTVDHQPPDATGSVLPHDDGTADLAAVPWNWLVGRSEQCDLDRAEALAWRSWYVRQAAEWQKLRDNGSQSPRQ